MNDERIQSLAENTVHKHYADGADGESSLRDQIMLAIKQALAERDREIAGWLDGVADRISSHTDKLCYKWAANQLRNTRADDE